MSHKLKAYERSPFANVAIGGEHKLRYFDSDNWLKSLRVPNTFRLNTPKPKTLEQVVKAVERNILKASYTPEGIRAREINKQQKGRAYAYNSSIVRATDGKVMITESINYDIPLETPLCPLSPPGPHEISIPDPGFIHCLQRAALCGDVVTFKVEDTGVLGVSGKPDDYCASDDDACWYSEEVPIAPHTFLAEMSFFLSDLLPVFSSGPVRVQYHEDPGKPVYFRFQNYNVLMLSRS